MKQIVLEKDWGRYKARTTLHVLTAGDALRPHAVDSARAAALVAAGLAAEVAEPKAEEQPARPKPGKTAAGKG